MSLVSAHWSIDFFENGEGWWIAKCKCGLEIGAFPDAEDACDALMDHAYSARAGNESGIEESNESEGGRVSRPPMPLPPDSRGVSAQASEQHPHEPALAPVLDADGRCLICTLAVADRLVSDLHDLMYDVPLPEQGTEAHRSKASNAVWAIHEVLRAPLASAESNVDSSQETL